MAALLTASWGALRGYRAEDLAAAREQQRPSSVVVHLRDDPSGQHGAPGCETAQPGAPVGAPHSEPDGAAAAGPSVFPTERWSGNCILVWAP
ncbi:hypothetical protein [Actinoplanes nipponensis]|uniref:hypothetical protein n=1 Tax=Actinoplanes nipponensis TaxID=135950 RepID=UPI0031E7D4BD